MIEIVLGLRQALGREAHGDKAIDLCNGGDPVCSSGNDVRAHSVYLEDGLARQAATFVAQRLTAAGFVARGLW